MRTILTIIAFLSVCGLRAQTYTSTQGRELPRAEVVPCATEQQAAAADGADNPYFIRIDEWAREGNVFSAPFTVPFAWGNRQVLFRLAEASADYQVRVNGQVVGHNANPHQPAEFNLTRTTKEGRNQLQIQISAPSEVAVLESWRETPPPSIGSAWILSQPTQRLRDVLVKTWHSDNESRDATAEIGLVVKADALNPRTTRIHYELLSPTGRTAASGHEPMMLDMRREDTLRFLVHIPADSLWSAERPQRYTLRVKTQYEGRYNEYTEYRLGLRTVEMHDGQLLVNGTPVTLRAKQLSPQAPPEQVAALRTKGYNTLRLSPGAVAPALFETCDTLGMYVVAQAAINTHNSGDSRRKGGNPSNDPTWQAAFVERAQDSYHTSKRHPSVIAFSIAERSSNGICLYESYLAMKRLQDPRAFIYPDAKGEWNSDKLVLE